MAAFRAARMEQKIVEVPEHEIVVALGRPQPAVARWIDLEKDLAVDKQSEKLDPGKTVLPAQLLDRLRRRQHGQRRGNFGIANPEQRAGSRRFQDHLVAAPAQISEPRQGENVGVTELRHSRPIIRHLRLDHDLILAWSSPSRAPRRYSRRPCAANRRTRPMHLLVDGAAADAKAAERQTLVNSLRALRCSGAEFSQGRPNGRGSLRRCFRPHALRA